MENKIEITQKLSDIFFIKLSQGKELNELNFITKEKKIIIELTDSDLAKFLNAISFVSYNLEDLFYNIVTNTFAWQNDREMFFKIDISQEVSQEVNREETVVNIAYQDSKGQRSLLSLSLPESINLLKSLISFSEARKLVSYSPVICFDKTSDNEENIL